MIKDIYTIRSNNTYLPSKVLHKSGEHKIFTGHSSGESLTYLSDKPVRLKKDHVEVVVGLDDEPVKEVIPAGSWVWLWHRGSVFSHAIWKVEI